MMLDKIRRSKLYQQYHALDQRLYTLLVKYKDILMILGMAIISRFLASAYFGYKDFWHDEAFQYLFSLKPISFILSGNDVHPPLFNLYTHYLIQILGNNIPLLRYYGATIFSVAFIFIAYYCVKQIFDDKTAFWTGMFLSVSITFLYYSFEFRNYSWTLLFIAMQILCFNLILKDDDHPAWNVGGYILFSLIILYSHYLTSLVIFTQFIYVLVLYLRKDLTFIHAWQILTAWVITTILCFPLGYYTHLMVGQVHSFWFHNITWVSLVSAFAYLVSLPLSMPIGMTLFIYFVVIYGLWHYRKLLNRNHLQFILYVIIPPVTMWLISITVFQFFHPRYFILAGWALFVLVGWVIARFSESDADLGWCAFLFYLILINFAFAKGSPDMFQHDISDSVDFLRYYTQNDTVPFVTIHSSQFSGSPYRVYFPDNPAYLITNLTKEQEFTAGGSVLQWENIYSNVSDVPRSKYMFWVSNYALPNESIIYAQGGLVIQELNAKWG